MISLPEVNTALYRLMEQSYFGADYRQAFSWVSTVVSYNAFQNGHNIFKVLQWVRSRHCLDDRDRIFAILGLQYGDHLPWNAFIKDLQPDYSRSVIDLYGQVACEIMKCGGTLHLLSSVHHGTSLPAWTEGMDPSWLPKWNEFRTSDLKHTDLNAYWTRDPLKMHHHLIYPLSIDVHRTSITVECTLYDIVALRSDTLLHADDETQSAASVYRFWSEVVQRKNETADTPVALAWLNIRMSDALCGTVYFFEQMDVELRGAYNLIKVLDWQQRAKDLTESEHSAHIELGKITKASLKMVEEHNPNLTQSGDRPLERIYHPAERLRGRRLFLTERNQVGLGPEAMRQGDVIVNLKGSTLPFILRPHGSFYRFVGAARIHDSMRRDAMAQAEKAGARTEVVEIR